MDIAERSLEFHEKYQGKIKLELTSPLKSPEDLGLFYTPGMAYVAKEIEKDPSKALTHTRKGRSIAMVCDGTAVLGFGKVGPLAAIPVLEGKSAVYKKFANLDAVPLCIDAKSVDEIVNFCLALAPSFAGIHLEDIKSPECFYVLKELEQRLPIPVFHDDQHGTAVVVLAGLLNALKVVNKPISEVKLVMNGAGAAGLATLQILKAAGFANLYVLDSKGLINKNRTDLNDFKQEALQYVCSDIDGGLPEAIQGADIFLGLSVADVLRAEDVKNMAKDPIIFALANPNPEIKPELAIEAGAAVVATGRADYPNQVNNVVAFPGIFKGALDNKIVKFTQAMYVQAAQSG